ncbi:MAG: contractile injection system tape measure protein [Bacteroidota bacterium]
MSYASDIIIGKVVVDYYAAPGQEVTGAMVNSLTEYIEAEVLAAVEEYLAELSPEGQVITCDALDIQLTEQDLQGWAHLAAQQLKDRLQGAATQVPEAHPAVAISQPGMGQAPQALTLASSSGSWEEEPSADAAPDPAAEPDLVRVPPALKNAAAFFHYLHSGVLPWYIQPSADTSAGERWEHIQWPAEVWHRLTDRLHEPSAFRDRWIHRVPTSIFMTWVAHREIEILSEGEFVTLLSEVQSQGNLSADRAEIRRWLTDILLSKPVVGSQGSILATQAAEAWLPSPMVLQSRDLIQRLLTQWEAAGLPWLQIQQYLLIPEGMSPAPPAEPMATEKDQQSSSVSGAYSSQGQGGHTAGEEKEREPTHPELSLDPVANQAIPTEEIPTSPERPLSDLEVAGLLTPEASLPEEVYQSHTGIVLLHAFLPSLFSNLGWLDGEHQWRSERDQQWAVYAIHYLASGEAEPEESDLFVAKLLAGWPVAEVLPQVEPEPWLPALQAEIEDLLKALHHNWAPMDGCSWEGLRYDFLSRDGKVARENDAHWKLTLEKKVFDMLLQKITWSLSYIQHPWMPEPLVVEWDWA